MLAAGFLASMRARVIMPLQTVANLLSALREGDFSIRARGSRRADPLYDLHAEVNALAEMLRGQRLDSLEATALLRKVMAELDVAVFTFDERRRLQLVNHAGERLLGAPAERLLDRHATELEMDHWLDSGGPRIEPIALPGATGRWEVRHTPFRQRGLPHHLVVLTDVSKPLRDEERARMAAPHSRPRPRAEQLAGADQVDCRQPGQPGAARTAPVGLGSRSSGAASASSRRAPRR